MDPTSNVSATGSIEPDVALGVSLAWICSSAMDHLFIAEFVIDSSMSNSPALTANMCSKHAVRTTEFSKLACTSNAPALVANMRSMRRQRRWSSLASLVFTSLHIFAVSGHLGWQQPYYLQYLQYLQWSSTSCLTLLRTDLDLWKLLTISC